METVDTYDTVVVGAGYVGVAAAYYLARAGLRTALLDRKGIGRGASGANYGNVQVQDAELDDSLPLVTAGWRRLAQLEEELAFPLEYRPLGSLLLVETEAQWQLMADRLPALHSAGVEAEMVPAPELPEIEPLLDHRAVLGACYHADEAQIYPFALLHAYLVRGRKHGLTLYTDTEVTGFERRGGRVSVVHSNRGSFSAGAIVLATGAWTPKLGQMLGRRWAIQHVRGQAMVTETSPKRLRCHVASAAFFEDLHEQEGNPTGSAALAVSQSAHGNFLLGEAATVTTALDSDASAEGQAAVAELAAHFFPVLARARVLRSWAAPVAFTADGRPFLGPVAGIENVYLAAAFKSTVVVTPVVGEILAQLVLGEEIVLDLSPFSPDREVTDGA